MDLFRDKEPTHDIVPNWLRATIYQTSLGCDNIRAFYSEGIVGFELVYRNDSVAFSISFNKLMEWIRDVNTGKPFLWDSRVGTFLWEPTCLSDKLGNQATRQKIADKIFFKVFMGSPSKAVHMGRPSNHWTSSAKRWEILKSIPLKMEI